MRCHRSRRFPLAGALACRRSQGARHGHDEPPEGPPSRSWGVSHAISSLLGWSKETPALPPLTLSELRASSYDGHEDGEVHHQPEVAPDDTPSNARSAPLPDEWEAYRGVAFERNESAEGWKRRMAHAKEITGQISTMLECWSKSRR